ncbi:hypothetical protein PHISCL_04781 [Aspergillus sclerotialis]|uniref:Uncharacterized protein n=1 Tax=Aspergillus sclerotialis TaxID=2070753 RepID=A0A3A2ZY07_9EURO|nr:hypothetical protein PHISCL_04781 [Aspergillus sclerotialis]
MCKQTYHHYPSCGHIANWTVDSCIEFTNTLRDMVVGQMMPCPRTQTTHDLLPLSHPTFCYQCEREWQKEIAEKGSLRGHPTLGNGNVSIEGLSSLVPVVEVTVKSSLGIPVDQDLSNTKPMVHEVEGVNQTLGKQPYTEQDWMLTGPPNTANNRYLNPRTPPLLPPSLDRFIRQHKGLRFTCRKNPPKPIVTNAYPREYSSFDTPTPSSSSAYSIGEPYSSPSKSPPIISSEETPILKPCTSSFGSTPTNLYGADSAEKLVPSSGPASGSSKPLWPLLSRPEEYKSIGMVLSNKDKPVDGPGLGLARVMDPFISFPKFPSWVYGL